MRLLKSLTGRKWLGWSGRVSLGVLVLLAVFLLADHYSPLPDPNRVRSVIVLAEDHTPLRAFADNEGIWRYPAQLDEVSPLYLQALLGYEDRWFYYHPGINPLALLRAAWQWLRYGEVISGGSTLTMQVARILDPHPRSLSGKGRQMFRALQLEWHYSKDEILNFYLNLAPFGGPIEGVQTASYAYLHKPALDLSHAEAALLAVLPQAPSRLRPDRHPERARLYRDKVLQRMLDLGVWDEQSVAEAHMEQVAQSTFRQPMMAPVFARRVKEQITDQARIVTTLDANIQWAVENILRSRQVMLPDDASAGILVMENASGLVRAYAGSADFFSEQRAGQVDMVQALRSPGSTLKPFLYGMAMDAGMIHSASLLSDAPLMVQGYAPRNFMRDYKGAVTVTEALQLSLNIPAVDMLQRLTPPVFDARLRHAGIPLVYPQDEQANLSMILGGAGARLENLVQGYSALARAGISIRPRYTLDAPVVERRFLSPESSWVIGEILRGVAPPNGFSAVQMNLAWKTGTSYGFRDAWAFGFNARYTVGVWTGRPDGTPLPGRFGARASGPLLFDVFQALPAPHQLLQRPAAVTEQVICWPLGGSVADTAPTDCQRQHPAWVIANTFPPTLQNIRDPSWSAGKRYYWVNPQTGLRVNAECSSPKREQRSRVIWPLEVRPWLPVAVLESMQLPMLDASCPFSMQADQTLALAIERFDDSTVLQLPRLAGGADGLPVTLKALGGKGTYQWLVNGELAGTAPAGGEGGLTYRFTRAGHYELTVLDEDANVAKVDIRVIQ